MRRLPLLALLAPLCLVGVAASASPNPQPTIKSPGPTPTPTPAPTATPTPSQGVLGVTPAEAMPGDKVTITGSHFGPNESVTVYLDTPDKAVLPAKADAQGSFTGQGTVPDVPAADHQLCVAEQPAPVCANLRVLPKATPTPTPSPSPTPTATPSPTATATAAASAARGGQAGGGVSPVATLLEPPFVIFPALILLALVGGAVMWIVYGRRRPAPALPPMRVVHNRPWLEEEPEAAAEATGAEPVLPEPPPPPAPEPLPPAPRPRPRDADQPPDLPEPGD